jgi:hypothetical protein
VTAQRIAGLHYFGHLYEGPDRDACWSCALRTMADFEDICYVDSHWAARVSSEQVAENDRWMAVAKTYNQIFRFIISRLAALEEAARR